MSIFSTLTRAAQTALKAVGAQAPAEPALKTLSAAHLDALGKVISGFPLDDVLKLVTNTATIDSDLDLADQAAGLVALAFPPGALVAGEAQMAVEALKFVLDAAGVGSAPIHVAPGVPSWFPPGGGPGQMRGR
jgi:hypothetical protein